MAVAKKKSKTKVITKAQFVKMTKAEQRVAIAKDVLKQIKAAKYIATPGTYIDLVGVGSWYERLDKDGQEVINNATACHVCGIGAAVCSAARVFDKCVFAQVSDLSLLNKYFSAPQRWLIENTFEGWTLDFWGERRPHCPEIVKIDDSTERLKAIFKNIVKNKGTFVPAVE